LAQILWTNWSYINKNRPTYSRGREEGLELVQQMHNMITKIFGNIKQIKGYYMQEILHP
jgi:hypothetical protein